MQRKEFENRIKSLLPKAADIEIPDGMTDIEEISDYITDQTGFCHNGFIVEG